jgi:hypothetical protein
MNPRPARFGLLLLPGALVAVLLLGVSTASRAQVPEGAVSREMVVPLLPGRGVGVLDAELRREFGLFAEVEGFVSATLLQPLSGQGWVLELVVRRDGALVRERRALDDQGLALLRDRITAALDARGVAGVLIREGRGGVVLTSTLLGLGYYGWALPDAFGVTSDRGVLAGYLLTSGASFLVPYLATRSRSVSRAASGGTTWGGTRGIVLGSVLGDLLAMDASDENRSRTRHGVGVAGSVLTAIAGYHYAGFVQDDVGRVALAGALGDFALAGAFTTAFALGLYEADFECFDDFCESPGSEATRRGHAASLALGTAGIVLAGRHARSRQVGRGDVRVLQSAGVLGAQLVAPLSWAALHDGGYDEERAFAGILLAGAAGGLIAGNRWGMGAGLTPGDGLLVLAGHLAGGAGALGLTYLMDDGDGDRDATLYLTTSAIGSLAGAIFTFRAVRGHDGRARPEPSGRGVGVEVHPLALFTGALGDAGGSVRPASTPTLLTVRF